MYKSYGMDAYQTVLKKSFGNAVLMQGGTFVEPETRILISISPDGDVTSPQNPSVSGKYKKNGDFFFQGYYEENAQVSKIAVNGKLHPAEDSERASRDFDGDFVLTDSGTGRKQKVRIENGLYLWEYEDKQEDDFTSWPVIVAPDGTIRRVFDMTVRSDVKNMSGMLVSSTTESFGNVKTDGSIRVRTITRNYGNGQSGEETTIAFSGIRGTENQSRIAKEKSGELKIRRTLTQSGGKMQAEKKDNPPEWYADFIRPDAKNARGQGKRPQNRGAYRRVSDKVGPRAECRFPLRWRKVDFGGKQRKRENQIAFFPCRGNFFYHADSV